jgi:hypothetical protein
MLGYKTPDDLMNVMVSIVMNLLEEFWQCEHSDPIVLPDSILINYIDQGFWTLSGNKLPELNSQYDWNKARGIYYKFKSIHPSTQTACGNPDCVKQYKSQARLMELHHLLPRSLSPSLTYDPRNMVFLCKECHDRIHAGWEAYWKLKRNTSH